MDTDDQFDNPDVMDFLIADAQSGNIDSQIQVGIAYLYGNGAKEDLSKAEIWFDMALANVDCDADYKANITYYSARIDHKQGRFDSALEKYKFVVDSLTDELHAYWFSQISIADICIVTDKEKSEPIYKLILANKKAPADMKLSSATRLGELNIKKDPSTARWYFLQYVLLLATPLEDLEADEIKERFANAHNNIGLCNEKLGNHERAISSYNKAISYGSLYAANNLAYMYEKGIGVNPDVDLASKNYSLGVTKYDQWKKSRDELMDLIDL